MIIQQAIELFRQHQKTTVKKSTLKSYGKFLEQFLVKFGEYEVSSISAEDVGKFLEESTEALSRTTRHLRYAQIKAFFNYVIEASNLNIKNPCNAAVLFKTLIYPAAETAGNLMQGNYFIFIRSLTPWQDHGEYARCPFKNVHHRPRKILDKETVEEIIFNACNVRDRLILELQARS